MTKDVALRWSGDDPPIAHLCGEIDLTNTAELFAAIRSRVDGTVVLDMSEVSYVDCSVLRQLERWHQEVDLRLIAGPGTPARRLLELTLLAELFQVYDRLDCALAGSEAHGDA
jgi:anti-anti-sigma factor